MIFQFKNRVQGELALFLYWSIKIIVMIFFIYFQDGEILQLPKNGSRIELLNNNQTLLIKYAALGDDGKYTCFATNKAGKYAVTNTLILAGIVLLFPVF